MNTRTWMQDNIYLFTDSKTGEVDEAGLAELYCGERGIELEPDGSAPDQYYKIAYQVSRAHEYKTGAREARISPAIGEFMNHVDSNFQFPKTIS